MRVTFTEARPDATWHIENPREYGWYSNVYPDISHPRWVSNFVGLTIRNSADIGGFLTLYNGCRRVRL